MKRSPLVQIALDALSVPEKSKVDYILNSVNLTLKEREVIIKSVLGGIDLETICNNFIHWNKSKRICSYSNIVKIKRSGMEKIGHFIKYNKAKNRKTIKQ